MLPSQMLKGILSGCVLAVISQRETYGYEISQRLGEYGLGSVSEGTIYPLLLRLEKSGFISALYRESASGPMRKYYSLTPAGRLELEGFISSYGELSRAVEWLLNEMEAVK